MIWQVNNMTLIACLITIFLAVNRRLASIMLGHFDRTYSIATGLPVQFK